MRYFLAVILLFYFGSDNMYAQENLGFKKKQVVEVNELEVFSEKFFKEIQLEASQIIVVLCNEQKSFVKVYPEHSVSFSELTSFHSRVLQELFTTLAILKLKEEEKLNLQRDIYNYKIKYEKSFKQNILVENVLTHTTGIQENSIHSSLDENFDLESWKQLPPFVRFGNPNEFIGYLRDDLNIQRTIVQEVAEKNAEEYIKDTFFTKFQLEKTSFEKNKLYVNGKDIEKIIPLLIDSEELEDREILKKETWEEALQEKVRLEDKLPGSVIGFFEHYENKIWGYVRVGDSKDSTEELYFSPKKNFALYIYTNSLNPTLRREFLAEFLDTFYEVQKTKVKRDKSPGYVEYLQNFEGEYVASQISTQNISKFKMVTTSIKISQDNGVLLVESGAVEPYGDLDGRLEFIEIDPFLFRSTNREIYISFKMNEKGDVEYLLSGSGQHGTYKKISFWETKIFHKNLAIFFFGFYGFVLLSLFGEIPLLLLNKISFNQNRVFKNVQVFLWLESILAIILFGSFAYLVNHYNLWEANDYNIEGNTYDYAIFTLPFGFILGMSLFTYYALRAYWEKSLKLYKQIQVGIFLLVSITFIYWLTYWNLLRYAF